MHKYSSDANPLMPYAFAHQFGVLAVAGERALEIHYRQDCSAQAIAEVARVATAQAMELLPAEQAAFDRLLQSVYHGSTEKSMKFIESMEETITLSDLVTALPEKEDLMNQEGEAPIIRIINALLMEALEQKASDIHIETYEKQMVVRFRVDGVLREVIRLKRSLASVFISRIKIMARLDIAEKRLPQDGHIILKSTNYEFDIRVSTIPGPYAERVELRLLDKGADKLNLSYLGMNARDLSTLSAIIGIPHGIVLITGPTGSGKTTTLYSALRELNDGQRSILTIEDPVEVNLEGIGQTEVNTKINMTFARGLRAILRQDPDIIMVGEIRDPETAQIAIQAGLTGHTVFSTLHTNSAVGAVARLYDMKIESYLLSSCLNGLVAQRLVRRLCDACKNPVLLAAGSLLLGSKIENDATVYVAAGCDRCRQTGYRGRIGLYEIIAVDNEMRRLIHERVSEDALKAYCREHYPDLLSDAREKILAGLTTREEVHRVIQ